MRRGVSKDRGRETADIATERGQLSVDKEGHRIRATVIDTRRMRPRIFGNLDGCQTVRVVGNSRAIQPDFRKHIA